MTLFFVSDFWDHQLVKGPIISELGPANKKFHLFSRVRKEVVMVCFGQKIA